MLMRRLTHLVVLAAFVFSCGGQWYALQGVAWIKMIYDYSQMVPVTEAVSMTFSGHYPCEICKAIAEKNQSNNDKICSLEKFDKNFIPPLAVELPLPAIAPVQYVGDRPSLQFRKDSPPTPPPRRALV